MRKPCTAIITKKITHFFKHKLCKSKETEIGKEQEQIKKILRMRSSSRETLNDNYLYFFKIFAYKSDYVYTYYLNLVEAIIKPQKLCLTCTELQSSCTICSIYRGLLTPEKYYEFISPLTGKNVSWKIRHN